MNLPGEIGPQDAPASYSDGEKMAWAHGWNDCRAHIMNMNQTGQAVADDGPDSEVADQPVGDATASGDGAAINAGIEVQEN